MEQKEIISLIKKELPVLVKDNIEIQRFILRLADTQYANRKETNSRFDRMLDKMNRDSEINLKKGEEQEKKWKEQNEKWWKHQEESDKKWNESKEESDRKWEEQNRKWNNVHKEIINLSKKHDSTIGALGARWGLNTEASFRNALKSILEQSFNVQVLNITDFDKEGKVFGCPDQIELDIIIKNGLLIICEIKSSISKPEMYIFERKVRFYEKKNNQKANRLIVISPMIDNTAYPIAKKLGIECFSYAEDVESL